MIRKWNLVAGDTIAIDSSKFRAVNSKKNNFNPAKIERQLKYIDDKIDAYLKEMEQADAADDKDHGEYTQCRYYHTIKQKSKIQ
jgi:hypothetical protein